MYERVQGHCANENFLAFILLTHIRQSGHHKQKNTFWGTGMVQITTQTPLQYKMEKRLKPE